MTVYLDHNATTPLDKAVLDAMMPYLTENFGNPSAVYSIGRQARTAVDLARQQVADLLEVHPSQVIFTGGGTEANNLAIQGAMLGMGFDRLAFSSIEHPSVRDVCRSLAQKGFQATEVPVDGQGRVDMAMLQSLLQDQRPQLLSIMLANNETGVLQDIEAISRLAAASGAIVHTDAVQAVGKIPVNFQQLGVQLLSVSSHKLFGPKGAGALIRDKRVRLEPLHKGGGQEKGLRSGTENVAAIVGFGRAAELALERLSKKLGYLQNLRCQLECHLREIDNVVIFSELADRLPNTTYFSVAGIDGETLLMNLDLAGFAVASGSACSSKSEDPSHVLMSMGVDRDIARGAIRVSLGYENTPQEIDEFVRALVQQVNMLRSMSAVSI